MEKIVNNDGYLQSGLMDIARQLLDVCSETGVSNIQIVTSPWKEGDWITLLARAGDKPILFVKMEPNIIIFWHLTLQKKMKILFLSIKN